MTFPDRCPSDVLDRTDVCDGFGAQHAPVAIPEVWGSKTLYKPGCEAGCRLGIAALAGSTSTALSLARHAMTCQGWEPCGHTAETTLADVYGPDVVLLPAGR